MKKSICLIIPSLSSGGAERQMSYLIQFLNEMGIKPTVITYYPKKDYVENLDINRIRITEKSFVKFIKVVRSIIKEKPDVVLSYTWMPNVLAIISSFFLKQTKIVVSERNTSLKYDLLTRMLFNLYRRADVVVANSNSQTEFIKQNASFLCPTLKTITNYTDINHFPFHIKPKNTILKIGVLARYHPQKNIVRFLEAVKILNQKHSQQMEFYWYGSSFGSEYYTHCENLREQYALQNVYFNNFADDVAGILQEMDVVCLPSLYEGFANALSEAVCAGKPVLASNVCDNPTFVKDGENGFLFDPNNPKDIAKAFEKLIMLDEGQFIALQKSSRKLATTLFSKEQFISNYTKILYK